jgi:hypothetical protein
MRLDSRMGFGVNRSTGIRENRFKLNNEVRVKASSKVDLY